MVELTQEDTNLVSPSKIYWMCFILVDLFKNFVHISVKAITKHFIKRQHEHEAGRNEWCGQGIALYRYLTNHRHSPSIDIYRRIRQFKKYYLNMVKNIVVILKNERKNSCVASYFRWSKSNCIHVKIFHRAILYSPNFCKKYFLSFVIVKEFAANINDR
jgi:hypothetical protein